VDERARDPWQQLDPCLRSAGLLVHLQLSLTTYTDAKRGQIREDVGDFEHLRSRCVFEIGLCGKRKVERYRLCVVCDQGSGKAFNGNDVTEYNQEFTRET
jgi:hypothetical protein